MRHLVIMLSLLLLLDFAIFRRACVQHLMIVLSLLLLLVSQHIGVSLNCSKSIMATCCMNRVGQNHIYTVYIRWFLQGIHQMYGQKRRGSAPWKK